jgi:hypothetical protein
MREDRQYAPGISRHTDASASTITIRIQKFSNVRGCSGPPPKKVAAFDVETVVGAPVEIEQELAQNTDGRRVQVNGREAMLLPGNESRGLVIIESMEGDIKVSVSGKGAIQAPELLAVAEVVDLSEGSVGVRVAALLRCFKMSVGIRFPTWTGGPHCADW